MQWRWRSAGKTNALNTSPGDARNRRIPVPFDNFLSLEKTRNPFLTILCHARDHVHIYASFECVSERHTIDLIKQRFRERNRRFTQLCETANVCVDLLIEFFVFIKVIDQPDLQRIRRTDFSTPRE